MMRTHTCDLIPAPTQIRSTSAKDRTLTAKEAKWAPLY